MTQAALDLTGKMLIAMPGMGDPRFAKALVFLCAHSPEGAMGLIVNKRTGDVRLGHLLDQLSISQGAATPDMAVHFGGPVEPGRGFVLHGPRDADTGTTLPIVGGYGLTATLDVLEDIAAGRGPEQSLVALGYAGWGPGQLESEIAQNAWLTCDATRALVFDPEDDAKWEAALASLGIGALALSAAAGRA